MRRRRVRAERFLDPEPAAPAALEARGEGADPLAPCDATEQAALVRRGELSPLELVEAALSRIERVDPQLGAVVATLAEEARDTARRPLREGPFRGVPFLLKDLGARQAGLPYWAGNRALRESGYRAPADTLLGARFRSLGLVTVGKSKTPEFGLQSTTQPLAFGPTRNPFDPGRSAGGSSGGACAAVAAGLVPVAHASDGAGSIRIPAAWCGLVGLKPSKGRIAGARARGGEPELEFVVARSLRDTAAFFAALALRGPHPARDAPAPPGLRVGVVTRSPVGETHSACAAAVQEAAGGLAGLGHRVEASAPAALYEYEERALHGAVLGPLHFRECLEDLAALLGRPVARDDVEPFLWEVAQLAAHSRGGDATGEASREWLHGWERRMAAWWRGFDLLVTPTVPVPAVPLTDLDGATLPPLELLARLVPHMALTEPFNATGQPALTLPLGRTGDGLPVGVQLVAARGRDELLLEVAARLEEVVPRPVLRPRLHA